MIDSSITLRDKWTNKIICLDNIPTLVNEQMTGWGGAGVHDVNGNEVGGVSFGAGPRNIIDLQGNSYTWGTITIYGTPVTTPDTFVTVTINGFNYNIDITGCHTPEDVILRLSVIQVFGWITTVSGNSITFTSTTYGPKFDWDTDAFSYKWYRTKAAGSVTYEQGSVAPDGGTYYLYGSGYLCEDIDGIPIILPGDRVINVSAWSVQIFEFYDNFYNVPIGDFLFGGPITVDMQADDIYGNPLVYTGIGSWVHFEYVKAGKYTVKITGPYFGDKIKYEEIIIPLMQPHSAATKRYEYMPTPLPQVAQPVWAGKVITWKDVANAERYEIKLYNASAERIDTQNIAKGVQQHDYTDLIENYLPAGSYTATVQALPALS